jgi:hypothetical protein
MIDVNILIGEIFMDKNNNNGVFINLIKQVIDAM